MHCELMLCLRLEKLFMFAGTLHSSVYKACLYASANHPLCKVTAESYMINYEQCSKNRSIGRVFDLKAL